MSPHFSLASYPPRHRLPCIVSRLLNDCPRAGLFAATTLSRPWNSVAATAWLGLAWLLPTLSTLSLLRQAKINWQRNLRWVQFHVSLRFTTFAYGKPMLEGLPRTWLLPQQYFVRNTQLKANIAITNLYPPLSCDLHTGSGIASWFHQSHLFSMLVLLLWHRGCLPDITGALFCCPGTLSGWFPVSPFAFVCCFKRPFCMFLSLNDILQPGASDHSVLYATAQLTEGRSGPGSTQAAASKKKLCPSQESSNTITLLNSHARSVGMQVRFVS